MSNADLVKHLGLDLHRYMDAEASIDALEETTLLRLRRLVEREKIDLSLSFIAHSGRKDSTALAALVERAFPKQPILYMHTPSGDTDDRTLSHLYALGRIVLYVPHNEIGRLQQGFRAQFLGHRMEEQDNLALFDGTQRLQTIYPIYDWSEEDVWAYILTRRLSFNDTYIPDKADYSHEHADCCPTCR